MKQYTGTKTINATPMNREAYNDLRGWDMPADEDGADDGYLVEYTDGGKTNVEGYAGYISWSPKCVFEKSYLPSNHSLGSKKLLFYTIVFNYGIDVQQYLTEDEKGRLCFVGGHENYKVEPLKIFTSYAQAKEVMDELAKTSFPNEGILQVCSLKLDGIGEPSKGNPEFLGIFA